MRYNHEADIVIDSALPNGWNVHCPGDETILTGVVWNLHNTYPGRWRTFYRTRIPEIWQNNPYQTPIEQMENPIFKGFGFHIGNSNDAADISPWGHPPHFMEIWARGVEDALGVKIPITRLKPDLYMTQGEREKPITDLIGYDGKYGIIIGSQKTDCKTKNVPPETLQKIIDALDGKLKFVRPSHRNEVNLDDPAWDYDIAGRHIVWPLKNIIDLQGRTGIRDLMRLVYNAEVIVCPITFVQHLSAGLPVRPGKKRTCIVLAGGREPKMLTHYASDKSHIHKTIYIPMPCNNNGGCCWKSHCAGVGDKSDQCLSPIKIGNASFAECMTKIRAEEVINYIFDAINPRSLHILNQ